MRKRYPHTATIKTDPVLTGTDTGLYGVDETKSAGEICVVGRLEHKSGQNMDPTYRAKFYTPAEMSLFENDDNTLEVLGRSYDISRVIPKQAHTEIWLK